MQLSAVVNLLSFLILCGLPSAWMQDISDLDESRDQLSLVRPRTGWLSRRAKCLRGRHRCSMPCYLPSCRPCPPCPVNTYYPDPNPKVYIVDYPAPNSNGLSLEGVLSQVNNREILSNGGLSAPAIPVELLSQNVRPAYGPLNIQPLSQLLLNQ